MRPLFWLKFDHKGVAHLHGGGALRLNAEDPILRGAEEAHERQERTRDRFVRAAKELGVEEPQRK